MTTTPQLTYGDLPDDPPSNVALHCGCSKYSASRGDHFMAPDDMPIRPCDECGMDLKLLAERTVYRPYRKGE